MTDVSADLEVLLSAEEIASHVDDIARRLAPVLGEETIGLCLLMGGLWFSADLSRALARLGRFLAVDGLWLTSYGDGSRSLGRCELRAAPHRPVAGRHVLIIDDVVDTGGSLAEASLWARQNGAAHVTTAVFARKPWPGRTIEPDYFAWAAPDRFLVGYGMDVAGQMRGLPYIGATPTEPGLANQGATVSLASISS